MSLLATTTIVPPLPLRLWPLCVDACVLSAFTLLILLLLLLLIKVGVVFISVRACLIGQLSFAYPPKLGNISIDCFYTCFYHQMCLVCAYYLLAPTVLHGGFGFEWGIYVVRCKVYLYIYMPFFSLEATRRLLPCSHRFHLSSEIIPMNRKVIKRPCWPAILICIFSVG